MEEYVGNLTWSILGSIHSLGGGKNFRVPSYSDMLKRFDRREVSNEEVVARVTQMIKMFS